MLHQSGRVNEPEDAVTEGQAVYQVGFVGVVGVDGDVADALSGQGKVLGMGIDHNGVLIVGEYLGIDHIVIDDPPIGFVADQIDGVAEALPRFG